MSTLELSSPAASGVVTDSRRRRNILIAMILALVAVVASVSGLNVAQQQLAIDLGASQSQLLWIINGYTMALAAQLIGPLVFAHLTGRPRVTKAFAHQVADNFLRAHPATV